MSEPADLSETELLAAEHALGVLTQAERAQAEVRMTRDPAFAALVAEWRARLAPLADGLAPQAPPDSVWRGVERALPANDNAAVRRSLRFWRSTTVGALGVAAASLAVAVMLAGRPASVALTAPMLNAHLMSASDQSVPMFVAAYDPARNALIVTSLMPPGADAAHVHELWIIPADGRPHPLGMIEPGKSKAMPMPKAMAPMFAPGSAIAVSVEPPGGSPRRTTPTGPIAAMGRLAAI